MPIDQADEFLPTGRFDELVILFPDPWPRGRDERRRLVAPGNLRLFARWLAPGARCVFQTDSPALFAYGRPACVQLAVLVDRGGREFPIQPDFTAHTIHIAENERITVQFTEVDPVDGVFIESSASH